MNLTQDDIERLGNNPIRGANLIVNGVEQNWFNGSVKLNSKSHPIVLAIDLILGTSHGFLNRLADANSRKFAKHARNISELSRNMADEERIGLFAYPSSSVAQLAMSVDMFMDLSVVRTETLGNNSVTYNELLVPKDTVLPISGYEFSILNGIRIQYNERSGWRVIFDGNTNNPLAPISTNLLNIDFKQVDNIRYIMVNIPVLQLAFSGKENISSNEASGCRGAYTYTDYLYGVRAFLVNDSGVNEIGVTFDQDVFDPLKVTLTLDIDTVNKRIAYEIPDVYIANGLGRGVINIYTYTTKGVLEKDLTSTVPTSITPNYQDLRYGMGNLNEYSAPLKSASGVAWRMVEPVTGGTDPVPFAVMKERVINGRQKRTLPITENNLTGVVESAGYSSVKVIDVVTGRKYALTRELPMQKNKNFYAPMSCYVGSHLCSVNDLVNSGVVYDNGKRVTIPHNVLFDISNPTSLLINSITRAQYDRMTPEQIVDLARRITLVYTPFYYVIDTTDKQAVMRTYHLDSPSISHQTFSESNPVLGLGVDVGEMQIIQNDAGYVITMITKSDNAYKELSNDVVGVQFSISPEDTNSLASIAGKLIGVTDTKERVWQFTLNTRFDIDINDVMYFTNFNQFGRPQISTGSHLTIDGTFIFTTKGDRELTNTDMDKKIDDSIFPIPMVGIVETAYRITYGKQLENMYSRIRPLIGEAQYQYYDADVPATYDKTEWLRNDQKEMVFDPVTGDPIAVHRVGEIIYEEDGRPRLKYRKGIDVVTKDGVPVQLAPRFLKYHWDFIAFDGNYVFSKDDYDKQFAQDTKNFFIDIVDKQMVRLSSETLDITSLLFQPRSKLGYQKVVVNSNYDTTLRQDLSFAITYYLTESGMRNRPLQDSLRASTPLTLNKQLFGKDTVSVADMVTSLRKDAPAEMVTAKMSAFSGDSTVDVISNIDSLTGFSIRKKLELTSSGLLSIQEDIDVVFLPHDNRMVQQQ